MLKERSRAVASGLRALDLALLALAFLGAHALRDGAAALAGDPRLPGLEPPARYALWIALALVTWPAAAGAAGVYGAWRVRGLREELRRVARAVIWLAVAVAAAAYLGKGEGLSRTLLVAWHALALAALVASRVGLRGLARAARRRGYNTRAFAVVGSGPLAHRMRRLLLARPEWGFTFAGFFLEDGAPVPRGPAGIGPVLGRAAELEAALGVHVLDLVVVALPRERLAEAQRVVATCEELGVPVKIGLALFSVQARPSLEDLDGLPVLSLARAPQAVLPLAAKRTVDVVVAAAGLFALAPILAVLALAVRLDSYGPVLFRQRRVGLHGRLFTLYKLRSMRVGAERERAALAARNEVDGPAFKLRADPRVTRVGRLLRRTSLDELPQLWNVLRGEMSLVGPRPPLPDEVRRYEPWQRRRLSMKPGLTCTWQVSGRSNVGFRRWVELDLAYIDGWSLWTDLRIVLRTIPAVLLGRGAR